jgi:hypothetical protein
MALQSSRKASRGSWFNATVFGIGMAAFQRSSHETATDSATMLFQRAFAGALGTIDGIAVDFRFSKVYGAIDRSFSKKTLREAAGERGTTAVIAGTHLAGCSDRRWLADRARAAHTAQKRCLPISYATKLWKSASSGAMDTTGAIIAPLLVLLLLRIGIQHRTLYGYRLGRRS